MKDRSGDVLAAFRARGLDALVAIGGDGSLRIASALHDKGLPVVGVPKTIDNDLASTVVTFGFDTAVTTATDAIDKLHSTAESHRRVMVVEVMGRYAGWIALNSGVAGTADVVRTLLHEGVAHKGLRVLFKNEAELTAQSVYDLVLSKV